MMNKKVASWGVLVAVILFVLAVACVFSHAETRVNRPNSLGLEQVYRNDNAYLFAVLSCNEQSCALLDDGRYTSLTFQPYNTVELYTESVLFCGNVALQFDGKTGPVIATYDRVGHRMYRGLACHDLVSVFPVHGDQITIQP